MFEFVSAQPESAAKKQNKTNKKIRKVFKESHRCLVPLVLMIFLCKNRWPYK